MNKTACLFLGFFFIAGFLFGQHTALSIEIESRTATQSISAPLTVNLQENQMQSWGVRIDGLSGTQDFEVAYKVKYDNEEWSELKNLPGDEHLMDSPGKWISSLQFIDGNSHKSHQLIQLQFYFPNVAFAKAEVHAINVAKSENTETPVLKRSECEKPTTIDRTEWCAGNCPPDPTPQPTQQKFMIVHHSASSNSSSDWSAVVESFYNYHVNGNGWDDIGYNWLIDPNGVIYTGRGDELQGAHFCGQNGGTAGICVIGTYTNVMPTEEAMQSLKQLLGWKISKEDLDPTESSLHSSSGEILPRITGHRIDCSTECPGDVLFQRLQTFPTDVKSYINNCNNPDTLNENVELSASILFDGRARLEWKASNVSVEQWEIYRKAFDNEYKKVAIIDGGTDNWIDTDLKYKYRYTYYISASDGSARSNEAEVFVQLDNIMEGISVYPIPTSDRLTIKIANDERGEYDLKLLNMRGEETTPSILREEYLKDAPVLNISLNVNTLQSGVYQLYIIKDEKVTARRIVVQ